MNPKHSNWRWLALFLPLLLLAACAREAPPAPTPAPQVEPTDTPEISLPVIPWSEVTDQLWVLVGYGDALNPTVVEEGTVITAVFSSVDNRVAGSAGCNNYFASYTADDEGNLTLDGPIGATMMACPEGMEQEGAFLGSLETVTGWTLTEEGRLELAYSSGQPYEEMLVYTPGEAPLTGTTWRLVSYGDPENLQEVEGATSITAEFSPETGNTGTVAGNATCNSYTTSYALDGDRISFGPVASTRMICPVGAEQELTYLAALESAETYQIIGPNLQITHEHGVLNYTSLNLPLENVLWQATVILGQAVPEEIEVTALFVPAETEGAGTVGGSAGCNSYRAGYETDDEGLAIPAPMAVTRAICPGEDLAELEASYLEALQTVADYEVHGDQLVLHTEAGDILYSADREPLLGTYWKLVSLGDIDDPQPPVEGSDFTAQFSRLPTLPSGTVVGTTGCNDYNATFTANLAEIKINLPSMTKNEDCPWGKGNYEVEQQFFLGLNSATHYRIIGNILQIPYGEGEGKQALNFVASQPPVEPEAPLGLWPLESTFWYLSAMGDTPVLPGTQVTAGFDINDDAVTGQVSGSGGCNAYNAPIGENFAVGPIASTKKACEQPIMDQESTYFAWLQTAYSYSRAGDQLLIPTADGILTFHSEPILDQARELQDVTWYLISYEELRPVRGFEPTAFFAGDGSSLNGATGCNEYSGEYTAGQGNALAISGLSSTKAGCPSAELPKQETAYLALLPQAVSYSVNNTGLQILTAEGGTMNFTSVPPAQPVPPTAVISGPHLGETGAQLTFIGSQSTAGPLPIVRYEWDMGDGSRLSGPTVRYAYDTPGTYDVKLTVIDQAGLSDMATLAVQINPAVEVVPPTAVISAPTVGETGQQLTFDGSGSSAGTAAIASYEWDMGDGSILSGPLVRYTYDSANTHKVTLTVTDKAGQSDSAIHAIQITPGVEAEPPKAVIRGPGLGETGEQLTFDGSETTAGTADIVDYEWDMGDGSILFGVTVQHTYDAPNTYRVRMTVIDQGGLSDTATDVVQINPVVEAKGPTAVIEGPNQGDTGQQLTFDGSQSTPGTAEIASYEWDMGDRTRLSEVAVQHTYDTPGPYEVSLTVTDTAGLSNTTTQVVQVRPVVEVVPPTAAIEGPQMAFVGEQVTFSAAGSQPGTGAITGYLWQSGDGNDTAQVPDNTFSTIYSQPGTYYPAVTVTDANHLADTASTQIVINATLEGAAWALEGTIPGTSISIKFANGTLNGFAGCNSYSASYTSTRAAGNQNNISVGPITATQQMCPEEIMAQERGYLAALQSASSYTIEGLTLTLATAGEPLTYGAVVATPLATPQ